MSMQHPKSEEWDRKLQGIFERVDHALEDEFGHLYSLRANRPARGQTSNPQMDGLFNFGASFTAGFGSDYGRGYVVDLDIGTWETIPEQQRAQIHDKALDLLKYELAAVFPGRRLEVVEDGPVWKIVGDFNLGAAGSAED